MLQHLAALALVAGLAIQPEPPKAPPPAAPAGPAGPAQPAKPEPAPPTKDAGPKPDAKPLEPKELLAALKARYAGAKTYRDSGNVHQSFAGKAAHENDLPFSTAFERSGRLLWQFTSHPMAGGKDDRYVVWSSDGRAFKSWWSIGGETESFKDRSMAFAGPTGVSGGSAMLVLPMLFKDRTMVWMPADPKDEGTEKVDGVECRRLTGKDLARGTCTLWIDAKPGSPALRKLVQVRVVDPAKLPDPELNGGKVEKFTVTTTITLTPTFDEKIADEAFDPRVPEAKK